jgi:hypothetical protein
MTPAPAESDAMSKRSSGTGAILRTLLAVLAGAAAWAVVGTLGNLVLLGAWLQRRGRPAAGAA